jgi:hypothetical protein
MVKGAVRGEAKVGRSLVKQLLISSFIIDEKSQTTGA